MKKQLMYLAIGAANIAINIPAHALVTIVADCVTKSNPAMHVTVVNNEGIGPNRQPHYFATVTEGDANSKLAEYTVFPTPPIQPVSFAEIGWKANLTTLLPFSLLDKNTNAPSLLIFNKNQGGATDEVTAKDLTCKVWNPGR